MENISTEQKNKLAAQYGLLIGLIYVVITSAVNLTAGNLMTYGAMSIVAFIAYFIIIGVFAARIRKANGGFIEFREIFGAVFIIILISCTMSVLYSFLYRAVLDPGFNDKLKNGYLAFVEKFNMPQEQKDKMAADFQKNADDAKHFSILGFFEVVIFDSLIGLIVCAIIKKTRPVFS